MLEALNWKGASPLQRGQVWLKKGEGRSVKAGGLWVYDNEIERITGGPEDGAIVDVMDSGGYFQGAGFLNTQSKIAVRLLTRKKEQEIDEDFLRRRIDACVDLRKAATGLESCRLVFGEADFLPGLTVDKYGGVLVVQSLALGIDRLKGTLLRLLCQRLEREGFPVSGVYERSDAKVRRKEGMALFSGFLSSPFETKIQIEENGLKFEVDVAEGQKTGYFLDQRFNRLALRRLCRGAKVLDCFTHTGSFALNAAAGGAASVLGVDASELAVGQAERNAALNGFSDRVRFCCADVFDLLPKLEAQGETFDVVVLDPPAFTKSRSSVKAAARGYREINRRAMALVRDGGYLATCTCSHFMTQELFAEVIRLAARDARCRIRQLEFRTQSPDHPILWADAQSYYLKFYLLQIVREA